MISISCVGKLKQWEVGSFVEDHNHALATPSKLRYLKSNRHITDNSGDLFLFISKSNMPLSQKFTISTIDLGGYYQMIFTQREFNNMR